LRLVVYPIIEKILKRFINPILLFGISEPSTV